MPRMKCVRRMAACLMAGLLLAASSASADFRPRPALNGAELALALHKLGVLGSVLYIGAHPDDENTALLSYLASDRLVRTGYLSLTRGDGGQNLIGSESGELLGVIRTQELLAARRIDGAEQFFTRAIDFGYSKSPEETFAIWGKDSVLADVVWVIRRFRPDVIITRFPTDGSGGHGHHTASAILAEEAFAAAADPARFPEQLRFVRPWQAKRLLWNAFRIDPTKRDPSLPKLLTIDVGAYNSRLGRSYSEIAGESRSMHKSQGFGSPERRGSIPNYFEPRAGDRAETDLFEGLDLGWSRIPGGEQVAKLLKEAERSFDPARPHRVIPILLRAHAALAALGEDPWVGVKREELAEVIRSAAGIWIEAVISSPSGSPGNEVRVTATVLSRADVPLTVERIELPFGAIPMVVPSGDPTVRKPETEPLEFTGGSLSMNQPLRVDAMVRLPDDLEYTQPFWLRSRPGKGLFAVEEQDLIGPPESPPSLMARFVLSAGGQRLVYSTPVAYRWTDPVAGERYRPFEVVPPVTAGMGQSVFLFPDGRARELEVVARSAVRAIAGGLRLDLPEGWRADPALVPIALDGVGAEKVVRFKIYPPPIGARAGGPAASAWSATGMVRAVVDVEGRSYSLRPVTIDHPHIPLQTVFLPAEARLVRTDLRRTGREVGYIMGSGDQIPDALREMGYHVTLLSDDDVERLDPARFDAVVTGVRAYNTRPRLIGSQRRLLDYVSKGGTLVVQYSTADTSLNNRLGPYPFTISRDRVTVEEAPVRFINPSHPLLQHPNRIRDQDFAGWVQERGLYFASPWDAKYDSVLSSNDPGEPPRNGGLLYARHGKGVFVYSAYAWFRELPAGVPGAYRIFANLVSGGH